MKEISTDILTAVLSRTDQTHSIRSQVLIDRQRASIIVSYKPGVSRFFFLSFTDGISDIQVLEFLLMVL